MNDYELNKIAQSLHPLERKLLPYVKNATFSDLARLSNIPESEISRPLQWLQEKGLVIISETSLENIEIGSNGKIYLEKGLPEERLLQNLQTPKSMQELKQESKLSDEEINISLGILRKKQAIEFIGGKISKSKNLNFPEIGFLKLLPKSSANLSAEEQVFFFDLKKRKDLIKIETKKSYSVQLTDLGKKMQKVRLNDIIDNLTPEILASGAWNNKLFRSYDINVPSKKIFAGRRHFVREAVGYIKKYG